VTFHFEHTTLIHADPMPASRNTVRAMLFEMGFGKVIKAGSLAEVREKLEEFPADLLICDLDLGDAEGDLCDLISAVRHGEQGTDPFVPVLATCWEPDSEQIQRVVNSGIDGVRMLPLSSDRLGGAIETLVERRRPFVVTSDYVGPDRRLVARADDGTISGITVPNSLRAKAKRIGEEASFKQCLETVNEQKVERHAYQIAYLVHLICQHYRENQPGGGVAQHLERLRDVALDLVQRIGVTKYAHQTDLCNSLVQVAEQVRARIEVPRGQDLELLTQLSLAIEVAVRSDGTDAVAVALDISDTVNKSLSRASGPATVATAQ
jgi:DNA-binding NarL/FixJ family response regulator